jgi:methyl-accepting chemotaxis protein
MEEIVTSVKRVTDIMAEIAAASAEQSSGIDQVNQAVTQMDEVTQQNAALVEQAAAAAESLEEQATGLAGSVSVFKMEPSGANRVAVARISAPKSSAPSSSAPPGKFSFKDAVNAHSKWKSRLIDYIKGKSSEQLDVSIVSRDDKCDLGCWIHGPAKVHGNLPEFKELKAAHADFHMSVGKIVQTVQNGKPEEATHLLGGEFFKHSKHTIKAIENLQARVEGNAKSAPARKSATNEEWEEF